jgi:hypothetical protein
MMAHLGFKVTPALGSHSVVLEVGLKHLATLDDRGVGGAHAQETHILGAELVEVTVVLETGLAQALCVFGLLVVFVGCVCVLCAFACNHLFLARR